MAIGKAFAHSRETAPNQIDAVGIVPFFGNYRFRTQARRRIFFNELFIGTVPVKITIGFKLRRLFDFFQRLVADLPEYRRLAEMNL